MGILDYFILDYDEVEEDVHEPMLGRKSSREEAEKNRRRLRRTLALYFTVALGVLAQFIFGAYLENSDQALGTFSLIRIILALVVGAIVFPSIYRSANFERQKPHPIQFFIAFQNGFFWQALLHALAKAI